MSRSAPTLSLDRVTRTRLDGRTPVAVLDAIDLQVWPGERVAILGGRRQGKTTLLRVAAGVEPPDTGVVRLDGADLGALSRVERTRRLRAVGYAPKSWQVARGKPALDHVALPLLAEGRPLVTALAMAHEALEAVGAAHCAGAATDDLTGDEGARVTLAQALVHRPRVLLVDEPGVLADAGERDQLLALLRAIAGERPELALVVTSRDVAGVAGATRVLRLSDGALRGATRPRDADVLPFPGGRSADPEPAPTA